MPTLHCTIKQLHRLAKARRKAVWRMWLRGKSKAQIARDLGYSKVWVGKMIQQAKRD
jgi:DNA-binding transcriptional regulator LsrR (DeoR family)